MDYSTLRPMNDRVLLRMTKAVHNVGSIVLPACCKPGNYRSGTVVAVGPGQQDKKGRRVPPAVQVGQKVAFNAFGKAATGFFDFEKVGKDSDGNEYILVNGPDIEFVLP